MKLANIRSGRIGFFPVWVATTAKPRSHRAMPPAYVRRIVLSSALFEKGCISRSYRTFM
jgi:hypothetical protein